MQAQRLGSGLQPYSLDAAAERGSARTGRQQLQQHLDSLLVCEALHHGLQVRLRLVALLAVLPQHSQARQLPCAAPSDTSCHLLTFPLQSEAVLQHSLGQKQGCIKQQQQHWWGSGNSPPAA